MGDRDGVGGLPLRVQQSDTPHSLAVTGVTGEQWCTDAPPHTSLLRLVTES